MKEYEAKISKIKEMLERAKSEKYRAEARLEQLQQQKKELIKEIEAMGVKPENIEDEIDSLKREIEILLAKAMDLLPTTNSKE